MINKTINIILSDYPSKHFPIEARFTWNNLRYQLVFETIQDAKNYFTGLFCCLTKINYTIKCKEATT